MPKVLPIDSQTLTQALHSHGIHVHSINKVARGTIPLSHLWVLGNKEICVRFAKQVIKGLLKDTKDHDHDHALAVSHSYYEYSFFRE